MKKVIAKWTYLPKDYFDTEILVENENQSITIKAGVIELKLNESDDADVSETHSKYIDFVESFFMRGLISKRMDYELKNSTLKSTNEDGTSTIYMKINPIKVSFKTSIVKLRILDKDGNEIVDDEEAKKKKEFELLVKIQKALNNNDIVKSLFYSYKNAIKDTENELVHLYEIRDGIKSHFKSSSKAILKLGILAKEWNELGKICNMLPLKQGRHRGQYFDQMRDATEIELKAAREISIKMISAFIDHLNT